jgi:predicted SAM-dependent methyltransferase
MLLSGGHMRLNLGCESDLKEGYLNIDIRKPSLSKSGKPVDEYDFRTGDVSDLSFLEACSCSEIRAKDILDHIYYKDVPATLKEWGRVLKDNGVIELLCIPDFERTYIKYRTEKTIESWNRINVYVDRLSYPTKNLRSRNILDKDILVTLMREIGCVEMNSWYEDDDLNIVFKKNKP